MSLRAAIDRWWDSNHSCPTARFKIISGSASAFKNKDMIERRLRPLVPLGPGPTVNFQATVVPEEAVLEAVYQHLKDRGADLARDVALLAEAGSAYAQSASERTEGPLVLPFPMRIGRLRRADGAEASPKADVSTPNGQAPLPLELADLGAPSDLFPTFFPGMHNPSDELVLGHLLEPNKTTFDRPLVAQFLLYGVVPLLTLLASLFPNMAGAFSWVADILRLVK